MKKLSILLLSLLVILFLGLLFQESVIAQQDGGKKQNTTQVQKQKVTNKPMQRPNRARMMDFVDENGNGICDHFEQNQTMHHLGKGQFKGKGGRFLDEDGDGVCDFRGPNGMHQRGPMYHGPQRGFRNHGRN